MKFNLISKAYKNKNVFITGNTGFKGCWLTLWMLKFGAKVYGFSNNVPTKPSLYNILNLKKKIHQYFFDIRDLKNLKKSLIKSKPDFIFHFAAQSLVKTSYDKPFITWETNTFGTLNLLESLKCIKKKCNVIMITSDKAYKNIEIKRGYHENDKLGGKDPYSASKAGADIAIYSYAKSYYKNSKFIKIATARAGNVIGGGDWSKDRLIPDCINAWSNNRAINIRNHKATRPWQHVLEVLNGYIILGFFLNIKKYHCETFNFGPKNNSNYKVEDILKLIKKRLKSFKWKIKKNNKMFESTLLKLNSTKANQKLKWKPVLTINEILNYLTEWYFNFYKTKKNMYNFSLEQINNFENKIK